VTTRVVAVGVAVAAALAIGLVVGLLISGGDDAAPVTATGPAEPTPPVSAAWTERGVNLTSYVPTVFAAPAAATQLDRIKATGSTTVSIVVTWYQPDKTADAVAPDAQKSATDAGVRAIAAAAEQRGLTVALKPHVDVLDGTFRGKIAPKDPAAWMRSYGAFVTHVADLAKEVGAGTLVVGTEMETLSGRTADWRALIAQVRARFPGRLTYAANWVAEAKRIRFWDALDLIGIDAYMPITPDDANPTVAEIERGWATWKRQLAALQRKVGKPVLFTELGYPSRIGAAQHPSQEGTGPISQPAQQRLYEGAFRAWDDTPWFHGIWWWDWPADGGDPVRDGGSYPPAGKLAEATMTRWLRGG
jgi:hypothetical protein